MFYIGTVDDKETNQLPISLVNSKIKVLTNNVINITVNFILLSNS